MIGLIGIDAQTGQARFTLGIPQLLDGIDVVDRRRRAVRGRRGALRSRRGCGTTPAELIPHPRPRG